MRYHAVSSSGRRPAGQKRSANPVPQENRPHKTGVVRALAWSAHGRWVSTPRGARASSQVTATDQRITPHCRGCAGVACRSVQTQAASASLPAGSRTKTKRRAPGATAVKVERLLNSVF